MIYNNMIKSDIAFVNKKLLYLLFGVVGQVLRYIIHVFLKNIALG